MAAWGNILQIIPNRMTSRKEAYLEQQYTQGCQSQQVRLKWSFARRSTTCKEDEKNHLSTIVENQVKGDSSSRVHMEGTIANSYDQY